MSAKKQRVPQSVIDTILDKNPIDAVVAQHIALRPSGGALHGICPFHSSRDNASTLTVDRTSQRFECSVCGFKGSAIGWLQYYDGCSFDEAITQLAANADVDTTSYIPKNSIDLSKYERAESLDSVASFFQIQLAESDEATAFVNSRTLDPAIIETFRIGFAPTDRESIVDYFKGDVRTLYRHGILVRQADGKFNSRFINRLMFPIRDIDGATIGFGGRSISDYLPKYLNSPGSYAFNKSNVLYGFYEAMNQPIAPDSLILVEGYIDVLMLHQRGFTNTVATLGTACTATHLQQLFDAVNEIVVCFDGDVAGHQASKKLIAAALPLLDDRHTLRFVHVPDNADPDTYVRESGVNAFTDLLSSAEDLIEYLIRMLTVDLDLSTIGHLSRLSVLAKPFVISARSESLQLTLIQTVEEIIGVNWIDEDIDAIKKLRSVV